MKRLLTAMAVALLTLMQAIAADYTYKYLIVQTDDGTRYGVSVDQLQIDFANGKLVVTNADGTSSLALSGLAKMYFAETADGTTSGISTAPAAAGAASGVEVFTLSGMHKGRFASAEAARTLLPRGVYVVKQADKSLKITIK